MANHHGVFRSNRFPVRDADAFHAWAHTIPDLDVRVGSDGRVALFPSAASDGHGLPSSREVEDLDPESIDFVEELAPHVAPGAVAVVMETGSETLRTLTGLAWAIRGAERPEDAEVERIGLDDIYARAAKTWGLDEAAIDRATD